MRTPKPNTTRLLVLYDTVLYSKRFLPAPGVENDPVFLYKETQLHSYM